MLFEYLMIIILLGVSVFFIGVPLVQFLKTVVPKKRNPLLEAKQRLEQAKLEKEAATLNKETEKLYEEMYVEALQDEDVEENKQEKNK